MLVEFKDVVKEYGEGEARKAAVDHVSFEIGEGEFVVILGASGSGKSTFVQTLNGLLKVSSGHIYYDGQDIDGSDFDR